MVARLRPSGYGARMMRWLLATLLVLTACSHASGDGTQCVWSSSDAGTACAVGGLTADGGAPVQESLANGETAYRNLTYASRGGFALQGDLFVPPGSADAGVIVVVHGGGWNDCGRRKNSAEVEGYAQGIAAEAHAASFDVEYRLVQEGGGYPENVQDVLCAVEWISAHAGDYGLDGQRIAIVGESTGGQLALSAALTRMRPDIDPKCGPVPPVPLVVTYSAPTDLTAIVRGQGPLAAATDAYAGSCADQTVDTCDVGRGCTRCIDASPAGHACMSGVTQTAYLLVHAPVEFDQTVSELQAEELEQGFSVAGVSSGVIVPTDTQLGATACAMNDSARQAHGFNLGCLTSVTDSQVLPVIVSAVGP
jgi:acetyl esterase/lipase